MTASIFMFLYLVQLTCAFPSIPITITPRTAGSSAASQLAMIATTSNTCDGAPVPSECATAAQAAPYLIAAMQAQGIYSIPEIAGVLSLMAYETGDFKYNINHYPGRAGQGTRNMQMTQYNVQFASSFPELAPKVQSIIGTTSAGSLTDEQANAVRALVLPDQYTWQSGAWFLVTHCASIRSALQKGDDAGFAAYMTCVGTSATSDRLAYWMRAKAAFGLD